MYAEIGAGGMATVFLALDLALDRKVAIKVMSPALVTTPGAIERFRREARTAAALSHPHIVPIFAIGEEPGIAYYVMKYVEGRSLDSVLHKEGAQSPAFVQAILAYVGGALHHAHQNGVVHRDVKPANIMLDRDGWTYVTDFGIAKREDGEGLTQSGMIIGTPAYMCPEQFNGKPVTGAADQYALGIVAYEMLAGRTPYDGPSLGEVMRGHLLEPVPPMRLTRPDVPPAFEAVVTRMLAKEPADRYANLADAVAALGGLSPTDEAMARASIVRLAKAMDAERPRISVPTSPTPAIPPRASTAPTVKTPSASRRPSEPTTSGAANSDATAEAIAAAVARAMSAAQPVPVPPAPRKSSFFRILVLLLVVFGVGTVAKRMRDRDLLARSERAAAAAAAAAAATPVTTTTSPPGAAGTTPGAPGSTPAEPSPTFAAAAVDSSAAPSAGRGNAAPETPRNAQDTGGAAPAGGRAANERQALRERLESINDRREAAGQAPMQAGLIRIGTTGPRYTVFVNGRPRQVINGRGLHDVPVPAGSVTISLRAMNCVSWDTVVTVRNAQVQVIGERAPHC